MPGLPDNHPDPAGEISARLVDAISNLGFDPSRYPAVDHEEAIEKLNDEIGDLVMTASFDDFNLQCDADILMATIIGSSVSAREKGDLVRAAFEFGRAVQSLSDRKVLTRPHE